MNQKASISLNPWFYVPFLLWVAVGGILYVTYGSEFLFRSINTHYNPTLDSLMYAVTKMGEAYVIIPTLILLMLIPRFRKPQFFLIAAVANVVPMLVQQGLKSYFERPRPLSHFQNAPWIHRLPHWPDLYYHSFPSGHSEGAFSFFCFITLLLPPRYKWIGLFFFILALQVCYSRVYLSAHFFEDTYAGSIIGVLCTTLCVLLLQPFYARSLGMDKK